MGGVRRHPKGNDVVLRAVVDKFYRFMTLMCISNKEPFFSFSPRFGVFIEEFKPSKTMLVCSPSI